MDKDSQIDNVQSFVEVIGDNDSLWKLLLNKEVSRFEEKVKYEHTTQDLRGVKYSAKARVCEVITLKKSKLIIRVDYGDGFIFRYEQEQFIRK